VSTDISMGRVAVFCDGFEAEEYHFLKMGLEVDLY
jgi:hypothetical protein